MALTLAVIPRDSEASPARPLEALLASVADAARPLLGPRYRAEPTVRPDLSINGGAVAQWTADGESDVFYTLKGRWAASSSPRTATPLWRAMASGSGQLRYSDPVWGTYMAVIGDKSTERLFAWNTVPTVEAVHYAQDADFTYVSNRPLLIALAMNDGELARVELDVEGYLPEYLNFGFSIGGATPFKGVTTLKPRSTLAVVDGEIGFGPAPVADRIELVEQENERHTGAAELADAFQAATRRCVDRRYSDQVQLRLSGGLDSRIILGLLRGHPTLEVTAVTQGGHDSPDAAVAALLAERAGVPHRVVYPELTDDDGFVESMRRSIFESQGFMPSEALTAPYAAAAPMNGREMLAAGQWPLFKGVLDKSGKNTLDEVRAKLFGVDARMLNAELNGRTRGAVADWMSSVHGLSNLEYLYAYARDIRSSRYLQPHNIQVDRVSQMMYPFLDSQVAAVADVLPAINRMRNISAFLAVEKVWPEALRVPTPANGRFRFEITQPMEGVSGPYYEERMAVAPPYAGPVIRPAAVDRPAFRDYVGDPFRSVARYLVDSPRYAVLQPLLGEQMQDIVRRLTEMPVGEALAPYPDLPPARIIRLRLWRLMLADLWLERGWMTLSD
ncbi:asparagine synthase-related protein [Zhihengliuella sp.]|uniref:asparagine synthase-related protein n=1 Tax=Zhihengliuella sp. TaxID=1954483 RepID=UPI0028124A36|nr:asparagine synthase-related protein [Zhihengliuella sp.]